MQTFFKKDSVLFLSSEKRLASVDRLEKLGQKTKSSTKILGSNGEFPLYNYTFDKGRLKSLVLWSLKKYGEAKTINLLENLKQTGFYYATKAGISLGPEDLKIPPKKALLLYEAEAITKKATTLYNQSLITGVERYQCLINTWHRTSEQLKQEVIDNFEKTDVLNPVYMMAFSGARGNISQVRQLVGMRGLMSNPNGDIIDYPIRSNFREGLTITEYIISSYGARKGIVDTALRTANAGYLTRRLVDVAQHVVISNYDCGTKKGVFLTDIKEGNKTIFSLQTRLLGRVLARDIVKKSTSDNSSSSHNLVQKVLLGRRNQEIDATLAVEIPKYYQKVFVRSALTCETQKFICQLCYGWSLAQGNLVSIGEAVGIVAAQSIGEPGTQLTMRTFHTGGAFSGDITDQIIAPFNGIVKYVEKIVGTLTRTPEGRIAFLTKADGIIEVTKQSVKPTRSNPVNNLSDVNAMSVSGMDQKQTKQFKIPGYTLLYFKAGDFVLEKQVIGQISTSARQATQREDASLVLKTPIQGQFIIQKMGIEEQLSSNQTILEKAESQDGVEQSVLFNPILMSKNMAAWDWGYAWVLSCNLYKNPLYSHTEKIQFIPMVGDFIAQGSILSKMNWVLPDNGSFKTSFMPLSTETNTEPKFNHKGTIFNNMSFKKNLLSLDIESVIFNKIGYFLSTIGLAANKPMGSSIDALQSLEHIEKTLLFLPTNLKNTTNIQTLSQNSFHKVLNYLTNDAYPLQANPLLKTNNLNKYSIKVFGILSSRASDNGGIHKWTKLGYKNSKISTKTLLANNAFNKSYKTTTTFFVNNVETNSHMTHKSSKANSNKKPILQKIKNHFLVASKVNSSQSTVAQKSQKLPKLYGSNVSWKKWNPFVFKGTNSVMGHILNTTLFRSNIIKLTKKQTSFERFNELMIIKNKYLSWGYQGLKKPLDFSHSEPTRLPVAINMKRLKGQGISSKAVFNSFFTQKNNVPVSGKRSENSSVKKLTLTLSSYQFNGGVSPRLVKPVVKLSGKGAPTLKDSAIQHGLHDINYENGKNNCKSILKDKSASWQKGKWNRSFKATTKKQITLVQLENMYWYQNQKNCQGTFQLSTVGLSDLSSVKSMLKANLNTSGSSLMLQEQSKTDFVFKKVGLGSKPLLESVNNLNWFVNKKVRFSPFTKKQSSPNPSQNPPSANKKISNRLQINYASYYNQNQLSQSISFKTKSLISDMLGKVNKQEKAQYSIKRYSLDDLARTFKLLKQSKMSKSRINIKSGLKKQDLLKNGSGYLKNPLVEPSNLTTIFYKPTQSSEPLSNPCYSLTGLAVAAGKLLKKHKINKTLFCLKTTVRKWQSWPVTKQSLVLNKQKPSLNPLAKQANATFLFVPDAGINSQAQESLGFLAKDHSARRFQNCLKFTLSCLTTNTITTTAKNADIEPSTQSIEILANTRHKAHKSRQKVHGSAINKEIGLEQKYGSINYHFKVINFNITPTNYSNILWYSFVKAVNRLFTFTSNTNLKLQTTSLAVNILLDVFSSYSINYNLPSNSTLCQSNLKGQNQNDEKKNHNRTFVKTPALPGNYSISRQLILAQFCQPVFEANLIFTPKQYKHGIINEFTSQKVGTFFNFDQSHKEHRRMFTDSMEAGWFARNALNFSTANAFSMNHMTKYKVSFSNINYSLMALASTFFLSTFEGEILDNTACFVQNKFQPDIDFSARSGGPSTKSSQNLTNQKRLLGFSEYSSLYSIENPLSYIKLQKIKNNQTRCLIVTADDLIAYKLVPTNFVQNRLATSVPHKLAEFPYTTPNPQLIKKVQTQYVSQMKTQIMAGKSEHLPVQNKLEMGSIGSYLSKSCLVKNRTKFQMFANFEPDIRQHQILSTHAGQIIGLNSQRIILRKAQPLFISSRSTFHSFHGDFVEKNSKVVTLIYQKLSSGDIVQGIPKVEQFFEARTTKRGRLFRENLPNLLKGLFLKYYSYSWQFLKQFRKKGSLYIKRNNSLPAIDGNTAFSKSENKSDNNGLDFTFLAVQWAVQQSFYKIQQIAVDGVLRVYRSQGVSISDKHLEIIVKQMTTKVRIIRGGQTGFFPGELVDLDFVETLNGVLVKKILYEPVILGITQASLQVDSFLSAASFQQTSRILSQSALVNKKDFLKGVKENVIVGNLIPTGTGYLVSRLPGE